MVVFAAISGSAAPTLKSLEFVGVVTGVACAFDWFGKGMSLEGQKRLGQRLKKIRGDKQVDSWVHVFPDLINRVFGLKALSWKFFFRSCIASFLAVAAVE